MFLPIMRGDREGTSILWIPTMCYPHTSCGIITALNAPCIIALASPFPSSPVLALLAETIFQTQESAKLGLETSSGSSAL